MKKDSIARETKMTLLATSVILIGLSRCECRASGGLTRSARARYAFTLIELLVVIAIIAILAAMLLPVLNRAKERAKTTECMNNMKQLQLAYRMYVDDDNDFLPPNETPTAGLGSVLTNSWVDGDAQNDFTPFYIQNGMLFQYNKQSKIYVCPSDTMKIGPLTFAEALTAKQQGFSFGINANSRVPQTRSYSVNWGLGGYGPASIAAGSAYQGGDTTVNDLSTLAKFSDIQSKGPGPAQTICFVDEATNSIDDGAFGMFNTTGITSGPQPDKWWNLPGARHDRGCNFSFADGHVEYWRWHGSAIIADQFLPYAFGTYWNADPLTGPGSSDDLARVAACQVQ